MRPIDADELMESIRKALGIKSMTKSLLLPAERTIIDQIDSALTVNGWISVKDRLPEEKVWVLCLCRAGIREVLRWQNGQWYHDPQHAYFESFVLYWAPLPEPPKESDIT